MSGDDWVGQVEGTLHLVMNPAIGSYDIAEHSQRAEEIWLGLVARDLTEEFSSPDIIP